MPGPDMRLGALIARVEIPQPAAYGWPGRPTVRQTIVVTALVDELVAILDAFRG